MYYHGFFKTYHEKLKIFDITMSLIVSKIRSVYYFITMHSNPYEFSRHGKMITRDVPIRTNELKEESD